MTQQYTPAQLEAWAGLERLTWWSDGEITDLHGKSIGLISSEGAEYITVIAASLDLARLVLEKEKEIARKDAEIGELSYEIECLRIALFKYGDRLGMANGPASLQGAIDEAMGQVLRPYKRALPPSREGNQ